MASGAVAAVVNLVTRATYPYLLFMALHDGVHQPCIGLNAPDQSTSQRSSWSLDQPVEINPTPINQSRVLVGTFSYSASLVAARMYDSDGCASLGTFLTPTHRTYSPIASARHGTISSRAVAGARCPAPGIIIMDKGQIAISRCRTCYKQKRFHISVQSDSNHVIPHKIFFAGSITI